MFVIRPSRCRPNHDPADGIHHFLNAMLGNFDPRTQIDPVDAGYNIYISVPGIDPESIQVNVENGSLSVQASGDEKARHTFFEDGYSGSWALPETADTDGITATCKNGILTLFVPIDEGHKKATRTVKVQA